MNSPLCKSMLVLILMFVPVRIAAAQQMIACPPGKAKVVQAMEDGSWETAEGRTIRAGQCISVPASVEAGAPGSITIFFGGNDPMPKTYSCENEAGCRVPIALPPKTNVDPSWKIRAHKIEAALNGPRLSLSPEKSTMTYVRGGSGRLSDGVVPLNGTQMDLAPAFQKMPEGEYWLRLVPLSTPAKPLGPFHIVWNAGHSAVVSNPEFGPGLYDLVLLEETGEEEGSQAWILAAEPPAYASESSDFADAVKVSAQWSRDASPSALRAILRAYPRVARAADAGRAMTRKKSSFWKIYWTRHFPILLLITAAVVGLEAIGLLTGPELWILDHALLPNRTPSPEIHLVEITDKDYAEWFRNRSPLKPELILGLIDAIVARKPRVIGIDIDTRDWGPLESIPCSLANRQQILFPGAPEKKGGTEHAQESATVKVPTADHHDEVTSGLHCFIPAEGPTIIWAEIPKNDQEPLELGRVLGQDPEKVVRSMGLSPDETQTVIGIPRFPVDPDGVVRGYRGEFEIEGLGGRMNSLARAVAEQYSPALAVTKKEVLFNFAGKAGAENYPPTPAGFFLSSECIENKSFAERFKNECKDAVPPKLPYLINKIVLVSGAYQAARDLHQTPIGEIAGVEMLAQAIDSDLHGGGIRLLPWPLSALLDLLASTLVVYLYFRMKSWPFYGFLLGWGIALVAVLMCFVLVRFKLAWLNVVPVAVGANLEQLWHHGAELRHAQRKK